MDAGLARTVLVRGDGPVGCTAALLLARAGLAVRWPAAAHRSEAAFRPIALSYASRLVLERARVWAALATVPIETIHVSRAGACGRALLAAADCALPALGYVVGYAELVEALRAHARAAAIPPPAAGEQPALVVHAEGEGSLPATRDYGQDALVARIAAAPAIRHRAWERFTDEGPLALLPLPDGYGLVWAMAPERAAALEAAPPARFLAALQETTGEAPGRFQAVRDLGRVRLVSRLRSPAVAAREVWIGNAAHTLHPVAGQGLNLGLRDAYALARTLACAADPGDAATLARYAAGRRLDRLATGAATDFLARAFTGRARAGAALGGLAIAALDLCAPARRFLARRMIYGAPALP